MTKTLVIARYNENLSWLEKIDKNNFSYKIYNKGKDDLKYDCEKLPNIGREAHTYIHYIIQNYNNLPDYVAFVQGSPLDHHTESINILNSHINDTDIWLYNGKINYKAVITEKNDKNWFDISKNILGEEFKNDCFFPSGAQYILKRENILCRSKDFYMKILKMILDEPGEIFGKGLPWCLERLWPQIFKLKPYDYVNPENTLISTIKKPQVYDCFSFFNELDLLSIRLEMLDDYVDTFILVESTKTHSNKEKPCYFRYNKHLFKKYLHKISHFIVCDFCERGKGWPNEIHQRNSCANGLKNCDPNDIVIISDLDEIPNPEIIKFYKDHNLYGIYTLNLDVYYYYLNLKCVSEDKKPVKWDKTKICRYSDIKSGLSRLRNTSHRYLNFGEPGFHFSFTGGMNNIIHKLESFAHTELDKDCYKNEENIKKALLDKTDLFDRNYEMQITDISNYPKTIVDNIEKYKHLFYPGSI